jgi:hypothetical protein
MEHQVAGTAADVIADMAERMLKEKDARIAELEALLRRVLAVADAGHYRDSAQLGLHVHPVMDDVREALNPSP